MTQERYIALSHKWHLRDHMEKPMAAHNPTNISTYAVDPFIEGANMSMEVKPPPLTDDYSHLNSPHWMKLQKHGHAPKPANTRKAKARKARAMDYQI